MNSVEVCLSPLLLNLFNEKEKNVVVIDILRATSSICTAFENGANSILPVGSKEEAKKLKNEGWFLAAERDGIVLDFADTGNSPHYFSKENIYGKDIAYSTTNGTKAIKAVEKAKNVLIGSFLNLQSISDWLLEGKRDVLIFCSGWKNHFNIEDTLYAGAVTNNLLESGLFETACDSAMASQDLWLNAKSDLKNYVNKISWKRRLDMPEVFNYCFNVDTTRRIPYLSNGILKSF